MNESSQLRVFRVSRWKQLIFPQELIIDATHVLTRQRRFPAFWILKEASIPHRSVASIQIMRGLFFSTIIIENSGGPYPIQIKGILNRNALLIRKILETYSPQHGLKTDFDIAKPVKEKPSDQRSSTSKGSGKNAKASDSSSKQAAPPVVDSWEKSFEGSSFDPLSESDKSDTDNPITSKFRKNDLPTIEEAYINLIIRLAAGNPLSQTGWMISFNHPSEETAEDLKDPFLA